MWLSANRETAVTLVTSLLWVLTITWASCQYVPLRASRCDDVRVRGFVHEPHLRSTGRPTQPESVACESTSLSGSRAKIRPDSSLIVLCRSDRSQTQNLTVFRSRATRQPQALWPPEGVLEISLPPSIHLSLFLAFALCDSNYSYPCCCSCCPCISGLRPLPLRSFVVRFFQNSDTPGPLRWPPPLYKHGVVRPLRELEQWEL